MPADPQITRRTLIRTAAAGGTAASAAAACRVRSADQARHAHPQARQPPLPTSAGRHAEHGPDQARRRADHGEPLVRQHPRDGALRGARRHHVDGLSRHRNQIADFDRDAAGHKCPRSTPTPCELHAVRARPGTRATSPTTTASTTALSRRADQVAMRYWISATFRSPTRSSGFPIGQRFFCSTLCQTYPNRRFFFAGTASGSIDDKAYALTTPAANGTIFDRLDAHHINWGVYYEEIASPLILPNFRNNTSQTARTFRSTSSTPTRPRASSPRSRSSIPTTPPPQRRTRRTSRSASSSSPGS